MGFFHTSQRDTLNRSLAEVRGQINVSFGFFPLHTSEMEQTLWSSISRLNSLKSKFVSVTYGTNPGERDRTYNIIRGIKDRTGPKAAPYLTCVDATPTKLRIIAHDCWNNGIRRIMALRGNLSPGSGKPEMYAFDLVTLLKGVADFDISVVTYPEVHPGARSAQTDLLNLRRKVGAGANRAITQFSFDVGGYLHFHDHCVSTDIDVEIIPGILPVSNFKQAKKFADMTSVRIPVWMAQVFGGLDDDTEAYKLVGANITMDMVKILSRGGVRGFHFYAPNRAEMSYAICHALGVRPGL